MSWIVGALREASRYAGWALGFLVGFGHVKGLDCPKGYNVNVPKQVIDRTIRSGGKAVMLLHALVRPRGSEI